MIFSPATTVTDDEKTTNISTSFAKLILPDWPSGAVTKQTLGACLEWESLFTMRIRPQQFWRRRWFRRRSPDQMPRPHASILRVRWPSSILPVLATHSVQQSLLCGRLRRTIQLRSVTDSSVLSPYLEPNGDCG